MTDDEYPYRSPPEAQAWQPAWPLARSPFTQPVFTPPLAIIIAGILLVLTSANAMLVPLAESIRPGQFGFIAGLAGLLAMCGAIGAQAALLAILVTLSTGPLWQRLAWHWGLAAMAFGSWCLGCALAGWDRTLSSNMEEFLSVVFGLPLIALSCQAAPWVLRIYCRWRIVGPTLAAAGDDANGDSPLLASPLSSPERPTIRDFLMGTVLVAVAMAAVRLGKPSGVSPAEYWTVYAGASATSAGLVLIGAVPLVYLLLGIEKLWWGAAGVAAISACATLGPAAGLILLAPGGPSAVEKAVLCAALVGGFFGTLAGTLILARGYGYRLVRSMA